MAAALCLTVFCPVAALAALWAPDCTCHMPAALCCCDHGGEPGAPSGPHRTGARSASCRSAFRHLGLDSGTVPGWHAVAGLALAPRPPDPVGDAPSPLPLAAPAPLLRPQHLPPWR